MEKEPNLQLIIDLTNTTRYYDKNVGYSIFISHITWHYKKKLNKLI